MWSTGLVSTTSLIIQRSGQLWPHPTVVSRSICTLWGWRLGSSGASIDTMEKSLYWPPVCNAWQWSQIIVLVWWVTGHGWKPFILLGFHHDARLYLECSQPMYLVCSTYLFDFDSVLEAVSFQLFSVLSTTQFLAQMGKTVALYPKSVTTESLSVLFCGEWLESDKAPKNTFFVGLLCWKSNILMGYQGRLPRIRFRQSRGPYSGACERCNRRGLSIRRPNQSSIFQYFRATTIVCSSALYAV